MALKHLKYYPENALDLLEYPKILRQLCTYTHSEDTQEAILDLKPVTHTSWVLQHLNQTQEAKDIIQSNLNYPECYVGKSKKSLQKLKVPGLVLEREDFGSIRKLSDAAYYGIQYFYQNKQDYPELFQIVAQGLRKKDILNCIDAVIEAPFKIKDNASDKLYDIRTSLSDKRKKSQRLYLSLIKKYKKDDMLESFEESFLSGRRVLAFFSEHKRKVKGIIHGTSESGRVTYIEPAACIEINNEVKTLEDEERREEYRLLQQLTEALRIFLPDLWEYYRIVLQLDLIRCKAMFAIQFEGHPVTLSKNEESILTQAFHPYLKIQNTLAELPTVPLNLTLNKDQQLLVISGPNAGGKTIALKTIALNQLLFQTGILPLCSEASSLQIFDQILVDIGDEQSIEANLSTYSARLTKMKYFLEEANERSFICIDEFGTGSDPELGGAIAESILFELAEKRCFGVITTHYSNIKIAGENIPHVLNANMSYNPHTLTPKFELNVGQPGSSFTFEVAKKIGLPEKVLTQARGFIKKEKLQLEELLTKLKRHEIEIKGLKKKYAEEKEQYERLQSDLKAKNEKQEQKLEAFSKAKETQHKHIQLGIKYEDYLKQWLEGDKERKEIMKKIMMQFNAELIKKKKEEEKKLVHKKSLKNKKKKQSDVNREQFLRDQLQAGAKVKLKGHSDAGEVLDRKGDKVTVSINGFKIQCNINELRVIVGKK